MKGYESYKDSGVEWIGKIPKHWDISKYKFAVNILSGFPFKSELFNKDKGFPLIRIRDISSGNIETFYDGEYPGDYIVKKGDLLVGMDGDFNIRWWNNVDALLNQRCCSIKSIGGVSNLRFLFYVIPNDLKIINDLAYYTTVKHLSNSDIYNRSLILPSLEEQTAIASFLDYKTNLIDATIEKKKRLIALLKEKRQAVINEAVTKGLNANTSMKDSGVEWLGKINKDWQIKKIKHTTFVKGRIGWQNLRAEDFLDYGPYYLVTGTDFKNGHINWEGCNRVDQERFNLDPFIILQEDDILITKDGTIGKIAIVKNKPENVTLNSGVFVTRPINNEYIPDYLFWVFSSDVFTHFIDYNKSGATIQHLYQNVFLEFSYPLPSIEEQNEMIIYLNEIDRKFQKTIHKVEKIIIKLQTYRQSLISEAVTGKIDVRDWQSSTKNR